MGEREGFVESIIVLAAYLHSPSPTFSLAKPTIHDGHVRIRGP